MAALLPILFCNPATNQSCTTAAAHQTFNTPLHTQFTINPVVFSGNDIVAFVGTVIIVAALALFMRRSKYGLAIRAASENGERATLLGVPVPRLDTIIWVVAAVLSTVAILLQTPVLGFGGFQTVTTSSDDVLIRILAAAVIGRMESMPRTAIAALAIGIFDSGATWIYANTTFVDATLVLVIIAALLLQRKSYSRVSESDQSTWRSVAAVRPIPRELMALPEVRWTLRGGKLVLAAVAILLPLMISDSQTYLAAYILIYAIVGLSLLVLTGWTGQISLGQFGIAGLAGAVSCDLYAAPRMEFLRVPRRRDRRRCRRCARHRDPGATHPGPVPGRDDPRLRHLRVRLPVVAVLPHLAGHDLDEPSLDLRQRDAAQLEHAPLLLLPHRFLPLAHGRAVAAAQPDRPEPDRDRATTRRPPERPRSTPPARSSPLS